MVSWNCANQGEESMYCWRLKDIQAHGFSLVVFGLVIALLIDDFLIYFEPDDCLDLV